MVGATVVARSPYRAMRTLQLGTNDITCRADCPEKPGAYPICMNPNALEWLHAGVGRKVPPAVNASDKDVIRARNAP